MSNGGFADGNVGITGFDGSQVVIDVVETFDKIHEHANDFLEVRSHQVEQHFTVFPARIKKDCPVRFLTDRGNHFVCMVYRCHN